MLQERLLRVLDRKDHWAWPWFAQGRVPLHRLLPEVSMFVAWLRVAFAAMGLAILTNLVTAHRLLTAPSSLQIFGQAKRDLRAQLAIASFNWQFSFSLIFFGVYLVALGWLIYRSGLMPRWLGAVLALDGGHRWDRFGLLSPGRRPRPHATWSPLGLDSHASRD